MDPYMLLSSRILHEERIAAATRRNRLLAAGVFRAERRPGAWRELVGRLLAFGRPRPEALKKRTAL